MNAGAAFGLTKDPGQAVAVVASAGDVLLVRLPIDHQVRYSAIVRPAKVATARAAPGRA